MKTLFIEKHKTNLTNILIDIYKNAQLGTNLGFKGGTAAMLFYKLPRFSTDLDFDLVESHPKYSKSIDEFTNKMTAILSSKYIIKDQSNKKNTLFWLLSYGSGMTKIKIEISTRPTPYNRYNFQIMYGVKIKTLSINDMIAHKLIALVDRSSLANRDLFDVHYFLGTPHANNVNYKIVKDRFGKYPYEFYSDLHDYVSKIPPASVLYGLGEVLDENQKKWAKQNLVVELLSLIEHQKDLFFKTVKYEDLSTSLLSNGDYSLYNFTFVIDNKTKLTFPIKISGTLKSILNYKEKDVEQAFKNKIREFLLLNPKDNYDVRPITTYDVKDPENLGSLEKVEIESIIKSNNFF